MSSSRCPACESGAVDTVYAVGEMMFGKDESFAYAACADCGTVRLTDVPQNMSDYYPVDYYSVDLDPERVIGRFGVRQFVRIVGSSALVGSGHMARVALAAVRKRQFHTLMTSLDSIRRTGLSNGSASRILDVGCGSGMLIYAMSLAGMRSVAGTDPFAPDDRVFDTGATVRAIDLSELESAGEKFDLIMFHHSFEHVPDPRNSLEEAKKILSADGRLLIRMPTVSSDAFEAYGQDWVQLDAPRHLQVFSREGMERLAAAADLAVVSVVDDSTAFQFWGSEQVRQGIALMDERSHMSNPRRSAFTAKQLTMWAHRAADANQRSRGDQASWVLQRR